MRRTARFFILIALVSALVMLHELAPVPPSVFNTFGHGPTVVLVHGLGTSAQDWLPVARVLARTHRVVMVDLPGHGESAMPEPFSLAQATLALDEALAEQGSEPVILVGHSVGGLVCTAEALDHPERVRGLVLLDAALKPQVDAHELAFLLKRLDRDYATLVRGAYLAFGRDSAQGERLWSQVREQDPRMVKRWIRLAWTTDLSARAASLEPPVLAVWSARSWLVGEPWPTAARELGVDAVPQLRPVRIEDSGHFIMLDQPVRLAALIDAFAANPQGQLISVR